MCFQIPKATGMACSAKQYQALWSFPHAVGAIDGKHVVLQCPRNSASEYFNYKNAFSIVLFALVDANYNFMFVDARRGKEFLAVVFLRSLSYITN